MDAQTMREKMTAVLATLDELASAMNTRARLCECCGLGIRENLDDWHGYQAFEAASTRVAKMRMVLDSGEWHGRSLGVVLPARVAREDGER